MGTQTAEGDGSLGTPTYLHLLWAFLCGFGLLAHQQEGIYHPHACIHPFTSPLPDTHYLCVLQEGKCRLSCAWAMYCNRKGPGNQGLLEITV